MPPFLGFWPKLLLLQGFIGADDWVPAVRGAAQRAADADRRHAALVAHLLARRRAERLHCRSAQWRRRFGARRCVIVILGLAPATLIERRTHRRAAIILDPARYIASVGLSSMKWLSLLLLFTRELILSALRVAWLAVQPRLRIRPAIIAYPLTVTTDAQITLLANLITLTPGTLSVDVSDDRKTLYVHAIDIEIEGGADRRHCRRASRPRSWRCSDDRARHHDLLRAAGAWQCWRRSSASSAARRSPTASSGSTPITVLAIGIIGVFAVRTGLYLYVDIAIAVALVGFLSTVAFARYLLSRGQPMIYVAAVFAARRLASSAPSRRSASCGFPTSIRASTPPRRPARWAPG